MPIWAIGDAHLGNWLVVPIAQMGNWQVRPFAVLGNWQVRAFLAISDPVRPSLIAQRCEMLCGDSTLKRVQRSSDGLPGQPYFAGELSERDPPPPDALDGDATRTIGLAAESDVGQHDRALCPVPLDLGG